MSFGAFERIQVEKKPVECDEDFINYMNCLVQSVHTQLMLAREMKNAKRIEYYQGMLFAVKSISQVYESLLRGNYI